jgi:tetratricopeptide (TPR) repeat protein
MNKLLTYCFVIVSAVSLSIGAALADDTPTLDQVYQAARSGRLDDAQRMMDKVLKEHPDSAKAHFVEAELLAKQGQMGRADEELKTAERLKPDLSFAKPQAVQDLRAVISSSHRVSQPSVNNYQSAPSNSFPWGLIFLGIGAIVIIALIMRAIAARNAPAYPGTFQPGIQNGPGSPMQPYGGGMGPMGQAGGGIGSGIMGGLATGAAVGVGMVAGEALAHHFMDGGRPDSGNVAPVADSWGNSSDNMGGNDFGIADTSSWSDNSSVADSSSGGSDWS